MTRKAHRKKLKRERQITRIAASRRSAAPWIVAGAFVATTFGKTTVHAQTAAGVDGPVAAQQAGARIAIAGGPLADVLEAFELATGVHVEIPTDAMRIVYSPGASGVFAVDRALREILEGTSITFRFVAPDIARLEFRAAAESVDVTAVAPRVASPKYTTPLRDIPQTINVIPSEFMEEQGASTLRDALRNVTGITFQAGEGGTPAGDQMTIRGFSARTDMFVDGIRDTGSYSRDTFNLEQVEVAKGPSSAVSGRGSTGGSVNLVSKTPQVRSTYGGTIEAGTATFERSTADINQSLGDGGAALRVNAMWTDGGVPRRDVVENQSWAVAPSLGLGLRSRTRATLSYLHLDQNNIPDYGLPWVPATNIPLAGYAGSQPPVDNSNFYGLRARDYEYIKNNIATGDINHDLSNSFTLRNVTRYGSTKRDSLITSPRFASNTSTDIRRTDVKFRDQRDTIVANQTNLVGHFRAGGLQHDIVTGIELSREGSTNYPGAEFGPDNPTSPNTDLFNPDPNQPYTAQMRRTGAYTDAVAVSTAAYAFDTVKLSEQWQLTGGLRWERFVVDYDSVAANGVSSPLSRLDQMPSWRAGGVYKPKANGSVYAGYATAFNPSAEGLALTTSTVNLEPETTETFELGTKWDVMRERISLNGAVFHTVKNNARTPGINPGDPPTVLAGEQIVSGLELGVSGRINRRWTGIVNYSFMHSDIPHSNTPAEVDQSLQFTPENTFYLWSTLDVWRSLRLGGGAQYMDSVFRNAANTTDVPSYWLLSSLVSYDVNTHLTLRLNGNNLTNAEYVDRTSGGHYIPGSGRALVVSTNVKF
jgi:catecholate siderophore receptor